MENKSYYLKKKNIDKKHIEFMYVYLENGEYFRVNKDELFDISITHSDEIVRFQKGLCPVVAFGQLKIKLKNIGEQYDYESFVNDHNQYKKDRTSYIFDKIINREKVKYIKLFNESCSHKTLLGNIVAKIEGDFLIFEFVNAMQRSYSKKQSTINLNDLHKNNIESFVIDFENCESCRIYNEEIVDINLKIDSQLVFGSCDYKRCIVGGYIKIKPQNISYREIEIWNGKTDKSKITKRLCGEKGIFLSDICRLYVRYAHWGYGDVLEEVIEIKEIIDKKYTKPFVYISGFAEKQKDGTILICFDEDLYNIKREQFYLKWYKKSWIILSNFFCFFTLTNRHQVVFVGWCVDFRFEFVVTLCYECLVFYFLKFLVAFLLVRFFV